MPPLTLKLPVKIIEPVTSKEPVISITSPSTVNGVSPASEL